MTDKRQNATKVNVNTMNPLQNSLYLWNIVLSRRSIWVLLELVHRWTQHFILPKLTRRKVKLNKFAFGTIWLPDLLSKHWFTSSVWNFRRWVADIPPHKTSPVAKSKEKQLLSQAKTPRVGPCCCQDTESPSSLGEVIQNMTLHINKINI